MCIPSAIINTMAMKIMSMDVFMPVGFTHVVFTLVIILLEDMCKSNNVAIERVYERKKVKNVKIVLFVYLKTCMIHIVLCITVV